MHVGGLCYYVMPEAAGSEQRRLQHVPAACWH